MPRSILTLTTDFGLSDYYVSAVKGVILSIAPGAEIVDITHEIPAFRIEEATFILDQAWRCFPKKTVHVVVVDPGVGSARRPILLEAAGHRFVGPDNGVFGRILAAGPCQARHITAEKYFRHPVSQTFHGRDVFAPVAAHLARGVPPSKFGKKIEDAFRPALPGFQRVGKRSWAAIIQRIDRFGNLVTSLPVSEFPAIRTNPFELAVGLERVGLLASNYADAPAGELFVIAGSAGFLEVSVNRGSAEKTLKVGTGAPVELTIW